MSKKKENNNTRVKTLGILLGGILGGLLLLVIVVAIPALLKNLPTLFKEMVPNIKVLLGYFYIGAVAFVAGRFSK